MDQLRLHATICRVRFVFWRIKMSAGAMIHCRFVKNKFQMWPAYASLLDDIRQKTNRTRLITASKRSFIGKYRGSISLSFLYIRQFVAKDTLFVRFFA